MVYQSVALCIQKSLGAHFNEYKQRYFLIFIVVFNDFLKSCFVIFHLLKIEVQYPSHLHASIDTL